MRTCNLRGLFKFINDENEQYPQFRNTVIDKKYYNYISEKEFKNKGNRYNIDLQPKLIFSESLACDLMVRS